MLKTSFVALGLYAGCVPPPAASSSSGPPQYDPVTPYDPNSDRTVSVVSALVGPGKNNGKPWDGLGDISALSRDISATLADAAEATMNPYALAGSIAARLASPAAAGIEPPDVGGRVELWMGNRLAGTLELAKQQDTYTPQWGSPAVRFEHVDVRGARLHLVFVDRDAINDDDMGIVDIDSNMLMQAGASQGGRFLFRAAEQTYNQILFIDLSVL